jgi:cell division protein FtsN
MKFLHAAALAVVLSLASVPVLYAQQPDQDKEKPKQQDEEKKKQPSDKDKEKHKPDDRANTKSQPDKDKPARETERRDQPQRQDDRARQDDRSARHEQQSVRTESNRGGGRRIPDERFRADFGTEHHFHVARRDNRHFEYGGYAFEYVDAWPPDWSDEDDVYIVLIGDEYYLVNVRRPEVRLHLILVD